MPAERTVSAKSKAGRLSKKVGPAACQCPLCGKIMSRTADVKRHMTTHDPSAKKLQCPWENCGHRTLQKSNLETHIRRHTNDKSKICTDDPLNCGFRTCDQSSLNRHQKWLHPDKYKPRPRKSRNSAESPAPASLQFESTSSLSILSPDFFPFREPSSSSESSLPPTGMPASDSLHCQLEESLSFPGSPPSSDDIGFGVAVPQMNGSHGWFGPADPTPIHPPVPQTGYHLQHNNYYTSEFQDLQPSQPFTSFTSTYGSTLPPTYLPLDLAYPSPPYYFQVDYSESADQYQSQLQVYYQHDQTASGDYFDQSWY